MVEEGGGALDCPVAEGAEAGEAEGAGEGRVVEGIAD